MLFSEVSPSGDCAVPAVVGVKFLAFAVSWSLEKELTDWIKMGQVVSDGLDWAGWRILQNEYFPVRIVFVVEKPALLVFRRCHRAGNFFIQLAVLFSLWSFPEYKRVCLHLALVFTSRLSKIEYKVEPDRSLQLCFD